MLISDMEHGRKSNPTEKERCMWWWEGRRLPLTVVKWTGTYVEHSGLLEIVNSPNLS